MTMPFEDYARYYDALYREKDYEGECDFLEQIFKTFSPRPVRSVLDLGCGTGGHALLLAQRDYTVTGVDRSTEMLETARKKAAESGLTADFIQGDVRNVDLGRTFDTVISMFAVISYQITNADLVATIQTARRHLEAGGLFVFDGWFGPAVLTERPTDRLKIVETNGERIIRFASPVLDVVDQTVVVNYKVLRLQDGRPLDEVDEAHPMRFLFAQEIKYFLETNGFRQLKLSPFMDLDRALTERDWNMSAIAQAV
jgi:SAM-dependent methyltransferase